MQVSFLLCITSFGCWQKALIFFLAVSFQVSKFFDGVLTAGADVKLAANWIMGDIAAYLKNEKLSIKDVKLSPAALAELIFLIQDGTISGKIGKEVQSL